MPGFELFGELERTHVNEVMDTGILMRYGFDGMRNGVWKAKEFEKLLTEKMQVQHALLVSSGTAALTVALASAGIGAGDEVIVPSFTFIASFEAILALGAIPIPVEIDDTLTLNPAATERAITSKTKAVMPVHMCGGVAQLEELKTICRQRHLLLVEDACQAIGGFYQGKPLGSYGDMGCFSFDFVKTVTCGEGGALITNNSNFAENAHKYSDHGHDHIGTDRGLETHPFLGYNFRISELQAAVGVAQLMRLEEFIGIQKKNYTRLREAVSSIPGVSFHRIPAGGEENYSFLNLFLPDKASAERAQQSLSEQGMGGCFHWFTNNWHYIGRWEHLKNLKTLGRLPQEVRAYAPDYSLFTFPQSDYWMGRTLSIAIRMGWSEEEAERLAMRITAVLRAVM